MDTRDRTDWMEPGRRFRPLRLALPLGGALLTGALGIATYTGRVLNAPRKHTYLDDFSFSPFEVGVPYRRVEFDSEDGVVLRGWWLPRDSSDQVIVGLPGHKGAKQDLLGEAAALWRGGSNVLLFDYRGCGESDPGMHSLAFRELGDVRAALAFARRQVPRARLGVIGYSMGGALAILVAAEDPDVLAVVADSPFATVTDVVAHAYRRWRLPAGPIVALADMVNRVRWGYPYRAVRPLDAVSALSPRPLLIIHGTGDDITPVNHAYLLHEAAGEGKELWVEHGVQHCGVYFHDREMYVRRTTEFFARALSAVA